MAFSKRPKAETTFIAGADTYSKGKNPWETLDPKGVARNDVHIRLNDYEMTMLRWLAEQNEDLSMQKIVRRALVPELQRQVKATT